MPSLLTPYSLPPVLRPHRPRPSPIRGIPTRRNDSFFRTPRDRNALVVVAKLGLDQFPDSPEDLDAFVRFTQDASSSFERLVGRAEGAIYALSDAAVETVNSVNEKQGGDWFSGITYVLESVLKVLKDGLSALHVPYSYGFAIILLTVLVKAATFPLTKKQIESTLAVRTLQPQIKAIQKRFAGDQERIQLETARLYKLAGVNPLAGCLPTLATIPVWIGLYRALSNVADEGLLTEGFFWIPSLSGPTTIAARQNGSGISWLFPFVDGHPPLGWSDTLAYLVLPLLLIAAQYISVQLMQPQQVDDPNQRTSQALTKFLPLMIGYFALSVPSGLSLYWLTNNILSTAQQVWLLKLGGAKNPVKEFNSKTISPVKEIAEKPAVNSNQVKASVEETKSDSEGLRPGERFKQIKEQEARRRKEREEEATMKAEEAIKAEKMAGSHMDDGISITSEEKGPKDVVEAVNGTGNLVPSDSSALRRSDVPGQREEV
ncbi:ALBINO3-like protein 1, chloroplastic isoform X2 [Nymphaea colorata]|uniref:ALBINO3-like protein 1, chloroplastic isoform X2 n=1 Tax=Nymphaea colorata TaxID=210225 RepID=UPI00129E0180|nr:ALBINO3-like protein 1, chloroplastic isoform X2 [Nymphaea colorata]